MAEKEVEAAVWSRGEGDNTLVEEITDFLIGKGLQASYQEIAKDVIEIYFKQVKQPEVSLPATSILESITSPRQFLGREHFEELASAKLVKNTLPAIFNYWVDRSLFQQQASHVSSPDLIVKLRSEAGLAKDYPGFLKGRKNHRLGNYAIEVGSLIHLAEQFRESQKLRLRERFIVQVADYFIDRFKNDQI